MTFSQMMTLETSTMNILLGAGIALQCFIVREIFSIKAKLAVLVEHIKSCPVGENRTKLTGLLPALALAALLAGPLQAATTPGTVTLAWDPYAPLVATNYTHNPETGTVTGATITTNWPQTFTLYATADPSKPLTAWPIMATIPGTTTNAAGQVESTTRVTVEALEGQRFFVLTVTVEGLESPFSNTAEQKQRPPPGTGLAVRR